MEKNTSKRALDNTRRTLISRLKNWDDQESWREFFNTYWRLIYSVAIKAGLTEQESHDAVQETVISVAKTMPAFQYDPKKCTFKTWLRHLAQKRIIDQFRKRPPVNTVVQFPASTHTTKTDPIARIADPRSLDLDAVWDQEWEKAVFDAAVAKVKSKASVEQFQIFDFYVLRQWPIKKVTAALGISSAKVYLAKHRVLRLIKQEAKGLEKEGI